MKHWLKKAAAFLYAGLLFAAPAVNADAAGRQEETYDITFRIRGEGTVKLENAEYGKVIFEEGERTFSLTPGSYVSVTARAADGEGTEADESQMASIAVTTSGGIELEPVSYADTGICTREITATGIDKAVDIVFGNRVSMKNQAVKMAAKTSESLPEKGDRFTGTCTVKSVQGGNGHTVHGVTLTALLGILAGEGDIRADCAQHSAAAPKAGMKYDYTYTITAVDKSSGKVTGSIYFVSRTQPATGEVDSEGYLTGYQALSGVFSIHREYSGKVQLKKASSNESITDGNSCYSLNGAKYGVYSDAACDNRAAVLTVKADGSCDPAELPAGRYYVREISAPKGYALDPEIYTADVIQGKTATVNVKDIPQSIPVEILLEKTDARTGEKTPGGSAVFEDAEFTVKYYDGYYDRDPALEGIEAERTWVMKTDASGKVMLQEEWKISGDGFYKNQAGENVLPLGTVTIQETKAPDGYLVNETVFVRQIRVSGNAQTVQAYNSQEIPEEIIRGDIQIVKFAQNPGKEQEHKTPLEGICFEITSKTTGETVEITTDANGYASTASLGDGHGGLIYDTYIVREKNEPEGFEPVQDFEIAITEQGKTLYYILEDTAVVSPVQLVKTDSTTGKSIPVPGVKFRLLDSQKQPVTMTAYYPEKKEYEIFETNENGMFLLPEKLPAGDYYFREVDAPDGYLLCNEDIGFTIEESHEWDSPLVISFPDIPVKGRIQIIKKDAGSGETLEGAGFEIRAAQDIVTPDGTVRAAKGELVDNVFTDENGKAVSRDLYLGRYTVEEVKQPSGYVLADTKMEAELKYKDQITSVVTESIEVRNAPTRFVIEKTDGEDGTALSGVEFELWGEETEESEKTFLVTGEDGTAAVEKLIPGTYYIRETKGLPGYLPDDTVYEFTVDENGKIDGEEVGFLTVENARTKITRTKAVNAETGTQELLPGKSQVTDTVSMENLCAGMEYMLRGVLMDWQTGEPLRENNDDNGAVLMAEKRFTASAAEMDIEMEFAFDAAAFAGRTIVVFEYLYQDGTEIGRHADLDDLMQQLYVKDAQEQTGVKKEEHTKADKTPLTGDGYDPFPAAAAAAGAAVLIICIWKKRRRM